MSGAYRWGEDKNNADYIVLGADHAFTQFERSDSATGLTVAPFNSLIASGSWKMKGEYIELMPAGKYDAHHFVRRLKIVRTGGETRLLPMFGANWMPEGGYVEIHGADAVLPSNFAFYPR